MFYKLLTEELGRDFCDDIIGEQMIYTFKVGPLKTNCYYVVNEELKQGFIIDPGDTPKKIIEYITETEIEPCAIFLTHGHFDHITAAEPLKEHYRIPILAPEKEAELLASPAMNWSALVHKEVSIAADTWLSGGMVLDAAGITVRVIETPGHTSGSVVYYIKEWHCAFVGDTIFAGGYGRTDCPTGDETVLFKSIHEKLFTLPPETELYPGHGYKTTVAQEKTAY